MSNRRPITKIIIHCSASDNPADATFEAIKKLHTQPRYRKFMWGKYRTTGKGFWDIGYHFVIEDDGTIVQGRDIQDMGAHTRGYNQDSIGICVTGNLLISEEQITAVIDLAISLCVIYGLPLEAIYPHNKFNRHKTCPNFDVKEALLGVLNGRKQRKEYIPKYRRRI